MTSSSIAIILFALVVSSFAALAVDHETFGGVNSRKKSPNPKKASRQPSLFSKQLDWTTKQECYLEDPAVECRVLENGTTCFGASIPFTHSSSKHLETLNWRAPIGEHLERFGVFAGLPECWRLLRELLCAAFYPPCRKGRVLRIPRTLCDEARKKCSFLVENDLWPKAFGDCYYSNETTKEGLNSIFMKDCKISRNINWQSTPVCMHPLASTDYQPGWMVDHCSLNCTSLRIDRSEPTQILLVIFLCVIFAFTSITTALLCLGEKDSRTWKPYFRPLCWFSICHLALSACWVIEMVTDVNTVCRDDGSIRLQEPSRREPLQAGIWCTMEYIALLSCAVGSSSWIVSFSYMHLRWRQVPGCRSFSSYHHLAVVASTIVVVGSGVGTAQIDGDPTLAVCFVSKATWHGVLFYVLPVTVSAFATLILFFWSVLTVMGRDDKTALGDQGRAQKHLAPSLPEVGVLLVLLALLHLGSVILLLTETIAFSSQQHLIVNYVRCTLDPRVNKGNVEGPNSCLFQTQTDTRLAQFQVILMCTPAFVVDIWLFVCADFRKRLRYFCKRCERQKAAVTSNGAAVTEMTTALADAHEANTEAEGDRTRCKKHRTSLSWQSSSSFSDQGAVSDPECHRMNKRSNRASFINRIKNRGASYRQRSWSSPLCSLMSQPSLKSGLLPSNIVPSGSSLNTLPFHDLNKYPIMPNATSNSWWPSFGWPYSPWPWPWPVPYYQHPSSASTVPANSIWPATSPAVAATPDLEQRVSSGTDNADASSSAAQDFAQAAASKDGESKQAGASPETTTSMTAHGNAPLYWPFPFSPFSPYWSPSGPMFPTPENRISVPPATTSCSSAASSEAATGKVTTRSSAASRETADAMDEGTEKTTNEDASTKHSENAGESALNEKVEEEQRSEENYDSEEEEEEDDEVDSEEVDSEEEMFVQEQLRLLSGKSEDCT